MTKTKFHMLPDGGIIRFDGDLHGNGKWHVIENTNLVTRLILAMYYDNVRLDGLQVINPSILENLPLYDKEENGGGKIIYETNNIPLDQN